MPTPRSLVPPLWPVRSLRFLAFFVVASALVGLLTGIPTELVPNPWFTRMTPVRPLDVLFWLVLSPLAGALLATYAVPSAGAAASRAGAQGMGTGVASVFAIGCPIRNKLVVTLIGASGALTYFAPVQPVLGFAALVLSLWALRTRLVGLTACTMPGRT